jgi:hypothetical protein
MWTDSLKNNENAGYVNSYKAKLHVHKYVVGNSTGSWSISFYSVMIY